MTPTAFEQFLTLNKSRMVDVDGTRVGIFEGDGPVGEEIVRAAEKRLEAPLPASYKTFLRICGSGTWCGQPVPSPEEIYAFDGDCSDMDGFVALVHNVDGCGNFAAINPNEQTGPEEWAMYYCSHDPFGYDKIADSFEGWAREAVTAFEQNEDLYSKAADDVGKTWRAYQVKNKKWWQFWL